MARFVVIFAFACGLGGCSSSAFTAAPASQTASRPSPMGTPIQGLAASQYECVTDEGYGRWYPCSAKP